MKCWCHYIAKNEAQQIWEAVQSASKWLLCQAKAFYLKPSVSGEEKKSSLKIIQVHYEMIKLLRIQFYMPLQFYHHQKKNHPNTFWTGRDSGPHLDNLQILTEHIPCPALIFLWLGSHQPHEAVKKIKAKSFKSREACLLVSVGELIGKC